MQKLNKNGLFVKRVVGNDFSVGNTVVEGEGASEDLAILNLTKEQMDILSYIINSEGKNIPIDENGKIETEIGHTYVITAAEMGVTVTDADFNELCKVPAHKQMGFVAKTAPSYVDNVTCTVTEVFRAAASVELSGNRSGEPEGDYVTVDVNGCITSGRLDTLEDGSYLQHNKTTLTSWTIDLPALSNGANMFYNCRLDKDSALVVLNSLPAYESGVHVLTLGMHKNFEGDADILAAIATAQTNGWTIRAQYQEENTLPANYTQVEYLQGTGSQYMITGLHGSSDMGIQATYIQDNHLSTAPICGFASADRPDRPSRAAIYLPYFKSNNKLQFAFDYPYEVRSIEHAFVDKKYTGACNFLGNRKITLDDEILGECEDVSSLISYVTCIPLFIFGNESSTFGQSGHYKLYSAKFSDGFNLTRDYIPALDETGAPCLYDLVEQKAYYNAGTSDFLYPVEATTYSLRRVLPDWGKLTLTGLRRLYHTPEGYNGELIDYALENGYKPIVETEKPEEGYWTPQWRETEDEIVLEWVETEPPMDLETQI